MAEEAVGKAYSQVEKDVMVSLEDVIDPELGIDMVNLGLIYDVTVKDHHCVVTMTLTTIGCPLGSLLANQITQAVTSVDGVATCDIELVWEPAWNPSMMSRFAKVALGIHG
ncbi:hypothetical protein FD41_GL000392 [Lentilactobacillus farraginis DSM 18382 = JCM 14108]|uniref:MIP18 family-like domain-containing protein n=2 Tax=Lentilactobacillus farraginis TaxID=390841 RepID=A0A0R1VU97_9LACO|nr:hypothetical protein FD41_GL000392 [Lentilactobacillus farraginis DSM 18382 = JCM 14108]